MGGGGVISILSFSLDICPTIRVDCLKEMGLHAEINLMSTWLDHQPPSLPPFNLEPGTPLPPPGTQESPPTQTSPSQILIKINKIMPIRSWTISNHIKSIVLLKYCIK